MQELLKKIEADALARLPSPPGRSVEQERVRFRAFLKLETHRLKLAHRNGASGVKICQARSAILDLIIRHLWEGAFNALSDQARKEFPPIAVVALGGYGRGELNPHSDIDLMFLHEGQVVAHQTKALPALEKVMNGVWLPLFDLGLKPNQTVRTIADCVAAANDKSDSRSVETRTSLIEARLIIGDKSCLPVSKDVLARCVEATKSGISQRGSMTEPPRRAKFGNSACMQEPNIKNGCGGCAIFKICSGWRSFKYRTRSLAELQQHGWSPKWSEISWRRRMIFCCACARNCTIRSIVRLTR
jgi:[protein-PII] uridylyltransferase